MTPVQRIAAARAFWSDDEARNDQAQATLIIAQHKKFRTKTVMALDEDRKARHLASIPSLSDGLAGRLLISYHLADQRPMMAAFLDAVGITHEEGLIKEDDVKPDPAKVAPAAALIADRFPADDVRLYLETLVCQDPEAWQALKEVPALAESARQP